MIEQEQEEAPLTLEELLKLHGAYDYFSSNVRVGYLEECSKNPDAITFAFPWVTTPQGREYWAKISGLWREEAQEWRHYNQQ